MVKVTEYCTNEAGEPVDKIRYGTVVHVLSKDDTKKVCSQGQLITLLMTDTGKKEDFTYGWKVITLEDIAKEVEILEDSIEPTDTEGHCCDTMCRYQGKEYPVYLSNWCTLPRNQQAAEDIYKQLIGNKLDDATIL